MSSTFSCALALCALVFTATTVAATSCNVTVGDSVFNLCPLSLSPSQFPNKVTESNYMFLINFFAPLQASAAPNCAAKGEAVCQYTNDAQLVAGLLKWDDSGEWRQTPNGVQVTFGNGDKCYLTGNNHVTTVSFQCSTMAQGPITVKSDSPCSHTIIVPTRYACNGRPPPPPLTCGTTINGIKYDFSSLILPPTAEPYIAKDQDDNTYKMNFCTVVPATAPKCASQFGAMCMYDSLDTEIKLVTTIGPGFAPGVWSLGPRGAIQVSYQNGVPCYNTNKPPLSTFLFQCNKKDFSIKVNYDTWTCAWRVYVQTELAC